MRITTYAVAGAMLFFGLATPADAQSWREEREQRRIEQDKKIDDSRMVKWDASPGHAKVGSMKPPWCHLNKEFQHTRFSHGGRLHRSLSQLKRGWYLSKTGEVAAQLCAYPAAPDWHRQTGYFVQGYINLTGLSKKDAIAAITARVKKDRWDKMHKATCAKLKGEQDPEASDEQKQLHAARLSIFGCNYRNSVFWGENRTEGKKLEWYLDKHAEIDSEIIKSYYVLGCLAHGRDLSASKKRDLIPYALCGIDARSLSRAKLERELVKGGYDDYAKTIARETLSVAKASAARYDAVARQLAKRDPEYKKIFFDVPQQTWSAWVGDYNKNKAAYEAAYGFENKLYGPSRRAMQGCFGPLRKHFDAYIKSNKPRTVKAFKAITSEGLGAVLVAALMPCTAFEGDYDEAYAFMDLYQKARDTRGPRFAVYYAVIDHVQTVRSDRTRFPIEPTMFGQKHKVSAYMMSIGFAKKRHSNRSVHEVGKGVVKQVKKVKDGYLLVFKTERWREMQYECKDTNKVWRIDNGQVKYYRDCVAKGYKTVKHTEKPIIIPAHAKDGIGRGSFVVLAADYPFPQKTHKRRGFPIEVYKSKKKKQLVAYFGIKL